MELIDILEVFRDHLVEFSVLIFEFIGVGIIIDSWILSVSEKITGYKAGTG